MHLTSSGGIEAPVWVYPGLRPRCLQDIDARERAGQVRERRSHDCRNLEDDVSGVGGSTHANAQNNVVCRLVHHQVRKFTNACVPLPPFMSDLVALHPFSCPGSTIRERSKVRMTARQTEACTAEHVWHPLSRKIDCYRPVRVGP